MGAKARRARRYGAGRKCRWCGTTCTDSRGHGPDACTKDHVIPKSVWKPMPGRHKRGALVTACRACNEVKGDLLPHEWEIFRREFPDYRDLFRKPGLKEFREQFKTLYRGAPVYTLKKPEPVA